MSSSSSIASLQLRVVSFQLLTCHNSKQYAQYLSHTKFVRVYQCIVKMYSISCKYLNPHMPILYDLTRLQ